MSGATFNAVPYRQPPQLIADLLGGRIHAFFGAGASLNALIEQKKLKVLATTAPTRRPALPQVPSIAESGFPTLVLTDWTGVAAPAGTPAAVIETLNGAINGCLETPEVRTGVLQQGGDARASSVSEFTTFVADEVRNWPPRVREAGLRAE